MSPVFIIIVVVVVVVAIIIEGIISILCDDTVWAVTNPFLFLTFWSKLNFSLLSDDAHLFVHATASVQFKRKSLLMGWMAS